MRAPTVRDPVPSGTTRSLAEALVEAPRRRRASARCARAGPPHRHLVGAVGEHVGGHQHRVEEQAGGRPARAAPPRLSRNWCMRLSSPTRRDARQQPGELGVLAARRPGGRGCSARGRGRRRPGAPPCRACARAARRGRSGTVIAVQVDDAVDRGVGAVLALHVLAGSPRCSCRGACARWAGCRKMIMRMRGDTPRVPDAVLDHRSLNRALLERQLLLRRHRHSAADTIEHLVLMQAQGTPALPPAPWTPATRTSRPAELGDLITNRQAVREVADAQHAAPRHRARLPRAAPAVAPMSSAR